MADNKNGREDQAQQADRRQRARDIKAELERGDELEPPVDPSDLAYFEAELEPISFPATGADIVAEIGDRELATETGSYTVSDLLPETEVAKFETPDEVRVQIQRPTVATAMKRVLEASETLRNTKLSGSQWDAYERTFQELQAIDAVDDDEGIQVITDWIVEQIAEKENLPGSRAVRRRAAKFCRSNGYQVRADEWLGV